MPGSWFDPAANILEIADTELTIRGRKMVGLIVRASASALADNPVLYRGDAATFDLTLGRGWREDCGLLREVLTLAVIQRSTNGKTARRIQTAFLQKLDYPVAGIGEVMWRFGPGVAPALAVSPELQTRLTAV